MKYKVGDKVRVRSKEWYDNNKSRYNDIECGSHMFYRKMSYWCGMVVTIQDVYDGSYRIREDGNVFKWTDEMIEGIVPNIIEEVKNYWDSIKDAWICPEGYSFKDENGNVINATKIVLEKKKKEYPKTYDECYQVTGLLKTSDIYGYKNGLLFEFQKLLIARDAYWKIAGEEMGLGKPWKPSGNEDCFVITRSYGEVILFESIGDCELFEFPTSEMRDAFYENFKELIEQCKELL